MITTTTKDRLYRVEFDVEHSSISKTGVVCYIYLIGTGVRIYYSHHVVYSRPIPKGQWSEGMAVRQNLNGSLKALIDSAIFHQIWSEARGEEIQMWPGVVGNGMQGEGGVEEVDLGI